jgi:hypothetical protein
MNLTREKQCSRKNQISCWDGTNHRLTVPDPVEIAYATCLLNFDHGAKDFFKFE